MRFPHSHGLHLEKGSYIENLRVPFLSEDPKAPNHSQIWFNTDDNLFKGAYQDGDAIKILAFTTEEKLNEFIEKIQSTKENEGANYVGFEGYTGANSLLNVNAGSVSDSLKTMIDAIDSDRKTINDSTSLFDDKIKKIQSELDATEKGAGLDEDGNYVANDKANYISDAASLADADNKLDTQVKANADAINQEISDRKSSDDDINKNISDLQSNVDTNYLNKTTTDEQSVAGPVTFKDAVTVKGNFYVPGGVTQLVSNNVTIGDNIITLNNDMPDDADPTENAGWEVNRGKEGVMPGIIWDEADDVMKVSTGKKDSDGNWILDSIVGKAEAKADHDNLQSNIDSVQAELDNTQANVGLDKDGNYVAKTNGNYIANATTVNDAIDKLDDAVKANQDEIDNIEVGAGLQTDGTYKANSDANYINEASSLRDADDKLDKALKDNTDKLQGEIDNLKNGGSTTQTELDTVEKSAGLDDDGNYVANDKANYISDAASLADADNKLDTQVKVNADAINSLDSKTTTANGELRKEIDGIRFIYQDDTSADAQTTYTVEHNLGSEFVDITLWILDDDGKWYNDVATVKIVDANNVEVDLSTAKHIRLMITNMEYLFEK